MIDGMDVSRYQTTTPDLTGQSFLFARATYATTRDASYPTHIANARKAGIVTGAYHFGVNGIYASVPAQVTAFLGAALDADLLALDLESDGTRTGMSDGDARSFISAVKLSGRKIGLYHSESGFPACGQDWNWIAKWGTTPPSGTWALWQWQGSPLDRDKYDGTLAELHAFAGLTGGDMALDANTQDPPLLVDIGPTNLYRDEPCTIIAATNWPGAKAVGCYAGALNPSTKSRAVRVSLSPGVWEQLYAPLAALGKTVVDPRFLGAAPPPGDYAKGKADQHKADSDALAAVAP